MVTYMLIYIEIGARETLHFKKSQGGAGLRECATTKSTGYKIACAFFMYKLITVLSHNQSIFFYNMFNKPFTDKIQNTQQVFIMSIINLL